MKIFSASQIKACDAYTIHASKITSYELMERAATRCVGWLNDHFTPDTMFVVICGSGNNGGDGIAIARMLHRQGYSARVFMLKLGDNYSPDCEQNLKRLKNIDSNIIEELSEGSLIADVPENVVIIDAILGTGLNRPVEGWVKDFIEHINELPNTVVSVDIPSGMPADIVPKEDATIIYATHTLSFQLYKRAFLHPETGRYAGQIHILDIGLSPTFIKSTHTSYKITIEEDIKKMLNERKVFTHKGDYGNVLIVGGAKGMVGAAVLSSKAAIRTGAGKTTALVPECGYSILQIAVPEAMCLVSGENHVSRIKNWEESVVGIGPGLGTSDSTAAAFADFITACKKPIVVDADGLNLLAKNTELMHKLPANSILTPHKKEFERLFGSTKNSMQMLETARKECMKYNIFMILKGHHSIVITPEGDCFYNMTGNPGMATGGSGDVLTGIVTSLLAQKYTSKEAAIIGTYIHGLAGDYAAAKHSMQSMSASDIIDALGKTFIHLGKKS